MATTNRPIWQKALDVVLPGAQFRDEKKPAQPVQQIPLAPKPTAFTPKPSIQPTVKKAIANPIIQKAVQSPVVQKAAQPATIEQVKQLGSQLGKVGKTALSFVSPEVPSRQEKIQQFKAEDKLFEGGSLRDVVTSNFGKVGLSQEESKAVQESGKASVRALFGMVDFGADAAGKVGKAGNKAISKYLKNAYKVFDGQKPAAVVATIAEDVAKKVNLPTDVVVKQAFFEKMAEAHPEIGKDKLFSFVKTLNIPESIYKTGEPGRLNFFRQLEENLTNVVGTKLDDSLKSSEVRTSFGTSKGNYLKGIKKNAEALFPGPTGGAPSSSSLMSSPPAGELPSSGISGVSRSIDSSIPQDVSGVKQRGFTQRIAQAEDTAPAMREALKDASTYTPEKLTDLETIAKQRVAANAGEVENALTSTVRIQEEEAGQATADAIALIKHYQEKGDFARAANMADMTAEKLTKAGQTISAARLYQTMSPESILIKAQKLIREANKNKFRWQKDIVLDDTVAKKLSELGKDMQGATGEMKDEIAGEIQGLFNTFKHVGLGRKLATAQTIGQLLNPKTMLRNVIGNELFYRLERLNKYVATPIDWTRSTLTGADRTVTFKSVNQGEYWKNFMRGARAGGRGIDPNNLASQFEMRGKTFTNKWLPGYWLESLLGATLKGFDNAAYMRARNETVGELSLLRAMNESKGLGLNKKQIIEKAKGYADDVDNNIMQIADDYGKYITFQDDNVISQGFSAAKRGLNFGQDFGIGDLVLKYPKTPGALLARSLEYSPTGFLKSAYEVAAPFLKGKKIDTRAATESLSRAITGSLGLTGLGWYLMDKGVITGKPDKDKDVASMERSIGKGQYKVNLSALQRWALSGFDDKAISEQNGDDFYSYDWAAPIATSIALGANANKEGVEGAGMSVPSVLAESVGSAIGTIQEQPLMSGLQRLLGYGDLAGGIEKTLQGLPSSFIPTAFSQTRQVIDSQNREMYSPDFQEAALNPAIAKIPGLASSLPKKYGVFGEPVRATPEGTSAVMRAFQAFVNPGFSTKLNVTPEAQYVLNLIAETGESKQVPRVVDKSIKWTDANGQAQEKKLTGQEYSDLQKFVGEKTKEAYGKLATDKNFLGLSPVDQVKKLSTLLTDIGQEGKSKILGFPLEQSKTEKFVEVLKTKDRAKIEEFFAKEAPDNRSASALLNETVDYVQKRGLPLGDQLIAKMNNDDKAAYMIKRIRSMQTREEKRAFVAEMANKKILSEPVLDKMLLELKNP